MTNETYIDAPDEKTSHYDLVRRRRLEPLKGSGTWGRCKASGGRFFWGVWVDTDLEGELLGKWLEGCGRVPVAEGFADSIKAAERAAQAFIRADYPAGYHFGFCASYASGRYRSEHARKPGRFKTNELNGQRFVYRSRAVRSPKSYDPIPIKGVTAKYVYIADDNWWHLAGKLGDDTTRDKYIRIDRAGLEGGGLEARDRYTHAFYRYDLDPDLSGCTWDSERWCFICDRQQEQAREVKADLKELRRQLQEHHPDRGGDPERFMEVKALYDSLKAYERRAA